MTKSNGVWIFITALFVALIVSGSAVFISLQYNQSQKDIANINAKAKTQSAKSIGEGICQTSTKQFSTCNFIGE
jgi:cell division protein FtsL